jgi:hypothetical protein
MPSATTTLATLGTVVINTMVSLATTVFTTYWPYFLVVGVLIGLVYLAKRFVGAGTTR